MRLLSVITINYNNVEGLKKTIKSVVDQTHNDIEYIVIDGGSNDGSIDVIKNYRDKIKYWVSEKDNGIYNAQNKGIKQANGEYLLFLNSGDYLFSNTIISEAFEEIINEDIIYCDMYLDNGLDKFILEQYPEKLSFYYFFNNGYLPHPSAFIKKDLFFRIGLYNESYKIISDWEFWLKAIFLHQATYKKIALPISVFNLNGISPDEKNLVLTQSEKENVYKQYFSSFIDDYKKHEAATMNFNANKFIKFFKKLKLIHIDF